jgi:hypothetical protein
MEISLRNYFYKHGITSADSAKLADMVYYSMYANALADVHHEVGNPDHFSSATRKLVEKHVLNVLVIRCAKNKLFNVKDCTEAIRAGFHNDSKVKAQLKQVFIPNTPMYKELYGNN